MVGSIAMRIGFSIAVPDSVPITVTGLAVSAAWAELGEMLSAKKAAMDIIPSKKNALSIDVEVCLVFIMVSFRVYIL